jgi:hypothetical protein
VVAVSLVCIAIYSKECVIITYYGDIWQKKNSKTLPANMATTEPADFHQPQAQNIYGCFFLQPYVLKT